MGRWLTPLADNHLVPTPVVVVSTPTHANLSKGLTLVGCASPIFISDIKYHSQRQIKFGNILKIFIANTDLS